MKETQTIRVYKDGTSYKFDENALFDREDEADGDRGQRSAAAVEKSEREGTTEVDTAPSTTSDKTHNRQVFVHQIC